MLIYRTEDSKCNFLECTGYRTGSAVDPNSLVKNSSDVGSLSREKSSTAGVPILQSYPVFNQSSQSFPCPIWTEGSLQALQLESSLQDLPLCHFQVELNYLGSDLAQVFEQFPALVGATLADQGRFVSLISRQQLLEYLIRPQGLELFLRAPLRVLHSYTRGEMLLLPGTTPIVVAAQQALRRSPALLSEPILVEMDGVYYLLDIHTLNIAYWQIRGIETQVRYERTQAQMIQSDKMASLGRLVDGVAHEILDPVSFIWGNLSHVSEYSQSLLKLLAAYENLWPQIPKEVLRLREDLEVDYVRQDLPQTIQSIRTGAERLSKLASSLQNFCHIDEVYPKPADLHELIEGILLLLKSRLSSEIQVIKHYGYLPPVVCYPGQLNQVFMNVLSNAVDALINQAVSQQLELEVSSSRSQPQPIAAAPKPTISITTEVRSIPTPTGETRWVSICIADNGPGLSAESQKQILESFSVERRASKETSLAVSYQIITAKHGGKFEVRSRNLATTHSQAVQEPRSTGASRRKKNSTTLDKKTNIGTQFEILLPLT